jgi:hypothetical protein
MANPALIADLQLQDALLSAKLQLPAGATTVISSAIDLASGPSDAFDPQRLEFQLNIPALTAVQIAQSVAIAFGVETSAYTSGASAIPYISGVGGNLNGLGPQVTAGTSGGSATTLYFKLPQGVPTTGGRFLFVTATGGASVAGSSAVATIYATV